MSAICTSRPSMDVNEPRPPDRPAPSSAPSRPAPVARQRSRLQSGCRPAELWVGPEYWDAVGFGPGLSASVGSVAPVWAQSGLRRVHRGYVSRASPRCPDHRGGHQPRWSPLGQACPLARTTIARAAALIVSKKLLSSGQSLLAICRWCASLFPLTCEAEQQLKEVDEVQVQRQRPRPRAWCSPPARSSRRTAL